MRLQNREVWRVQILAAAALTSISKGPSFAWQAPYITFRLVGLSTHTLTKLRRIHPFFGALHALPFCITVMTEGSLEKDRAPKRTKVVRTGLDESDATTGKFTPRDSSWRNWISNGKQN
jgi:hypothetical protein